MMSGADHVKICTSGGVLSPTDKLTGSQFTVPEIKAVCDTVRMMVSHRLWFTVGAKLSGWHVSDVALQHRRRREKRNRRWYRWYRTRRSVERRYLETHGEEGDPLHSDPDHTGREFLLLLVKFDGMGKMLKRLVCCQWTYGSTDPEIFARKRTTYRQKFIQSNQEGSRARGECRLRDRCARSNHVGRIRSESQSAPRTCDTPASNMQWR